jgi:mono/diheme cytochrome c family protein
MRTFYPIALIAVAACANASPSQTSIQVVFNGEAVAAPIAPPPVSGGTLAVVSPATPASTDHDVQAWIVAAVPESDSVHIVGVSAAGQTKRADVALGTGDEPGRVIGDALGRAHVALRAAGDVVTIDPATAAIIARRHACDAPRGIAYDAPIDSIHVACANGELVTLPAAGGAETRRVFVDRDLRDVVITPASPLVVNQSSTSKNPSPTSPSPSPLLVTRFRSAELLSLDASGAIKERFGAPSPFDTHLAHVAWRMVATRTGAAITYQVESTSPIDVGGGPSPSTPAPYGGSNMPLVASVVAQADAAGFGGLGAGSIGGASPSVDVAVSDDGSTAVAAGNVVFLNASGGQMARLTNNTGAYRQVTSVAFFHLHDSSDHLVLASQWRGGGAGYEGAVAFYLPGQNGVWMPSSAGGFALPGVVDTGLDIFQTPTNSNIACASCHPEGGDDGHTWTFAMEGGTRVRRTQTLRGGILGAAPFHWDADIANTRAVCDVIFSERMGGGAVTDAQIPVFEHFLNAIPRLPARANLDPARIDAGRALFEGRGQCSSCHTGDQFTNAQKADVGKDVPLKVGRLVNVGDRAPFMHDGCAATLLDRFDPQCGGDHHGAQDLTNSEKQDLVQYLESL